MSSHHKPKHFSRHSFSEGLSASATDIQIDRLVYELYDLSEKEIKIVEDR